MPHHTDTPERGEQPSLGRLYVHRDLAATYQDALQAGEIAGHEGQIRGLSASINREHYPSKVVCVNDG